MHTVRNRVINGLKQTLAFAGVVAVVIASLAGTITTPNTELRFGHFIVGAADTGFGMYQREKHSTYFVSFPTQPTVKPSTVAAFVQNRLAHISYYLGYRNMTSPNGATGHVDNDSLTLYFPTPTVSLSYNRDDILFNDSDMLFTDTADSDVVSLEKVYGGYLNKTEETIVRGNLFVRNPNVPGYFAIIAKPTQEIAVDKDNKRIMIANRMQASSIVVKIQTYD